MKAGYCNVILLAGSLLSAGAWSHSHLAVNTFPEAKSFSEKVSTQTVEVTSERWRQLVANAKPVTAWQQKKTAQPYGQRLTVKSMMERHQQILWLSRQPALTEAQSNWLINVAEQGGVIVTRSADHPQKTIPLVHLSNQSRSVLTLHDSKQKAAQILSNAAIPELTALLIQSRLTQQLVLNALAQTQVTFLQQRLLQHTAGEAELWTDTVARLAYLLLKRQPHAELAGKLLQHNQNQYSVLILRSLPTDYTQDNAIRLLKISLASSYLRSMAYQTLVRHYADSQATRDILLNGLGDQDHFWQALMAAKLLSWQKHQESLMPLKAGLTGKKSHMLATLANRGQ